MGTGNVVGMVPMSGLVLAGSGNPLAGQLRSDTGGAHAPSGESKYTLNHNSGFRVWFQPSVCAFLIAVGADFALILAPLHLGIFGAFGFDRHIPAVILADEIFESNVHSTSVALEAVRVKIIADRNEAGMEQGKYPLNEISGFQTVPPEAGEVSLC